MKNAIKDAVERGNSEALELISRQIEDAQLGLDEFKQESFMTLMETLSDEKFRGMQGSWRLLTVLIDDESKLTSDQRDALLAGVQASYGRFTDQITSFYLSELVGKVFANDRGLDLLKTLLTTDDEISRSFVAHGFEHLVKEGEPAIATEAFRWLIDLADDQSERMRYEVALSLSRLKRKLDDPERGRLDQVLARLARELRNS